VYLESWSELSNALVQATALAVILLRGDRREMLHATWHCCSLVLAKILLDPIGVRKQVSHLLPGLYLWAIPPGDSKIVSIGPYACATRACIGSEAGETGV